MYIPEDNKIFFYFETTLSQLTKLSVVKKGVPLVSLCHFELS